MLYQTEGIVLSQEDQDENDKVIVLLTKDEGLIRAKVKGAKKPKSKLSGPTQTFSHGIYQLFRGKSLDRVIQVILKDSHKGLFDDYQKMVYASYLSEITQEFLPEREINQEAFFLLAKALSCLEEKEDPWPVARWSELGFLVLAGFSPSFSSCFQCGSEPQESAVFSFSRGSVACEKCAEGMAESVPGVPGSQSGGIQGTKGDFMKISQGTRKTLNLFLEEVASKMPLKACPSVSARGIVRKECASLLERYITYILEKRLRSMTLVESIENERAKV